MGPGPGNALPDQPFPAKDRFDLLALSGGVQAEPVGILIKQEEDLYDAVARQITNVQSFSQPRQSLLDAEYQLLGALIGLGHCSGGGEWGDKDKSGETGTDHREVPFPK